MGSNNKKTFYWISQKLLNYFDNINNIYFSTNVESGVNFNNNSPTYQNSRLSIKLKDNTTNNELSYSFDSVEIFKFLSAFSKIKENKTKKIELKTNYKDYSKRFELNVGSQIPQITIFDPKQAANKLSVNVEKDLLFTMEYLFKSFITNAINISLSFNQLSLKERMLDEIIKLNSLIENQSFTSSRRIEKTIQNSINNIVKDVKEELDEVEEDVDVDIDTDTVENNIDKEDIDDDCPFDLVEDDKPNESVKEDSGFSISMDELKNIKLENYDSVVKSKEEPIEKKSVESEKPVSRYNLLNPLLHSCINWDLDNLTQWIDTFVLANEKSDALSFAPLEVLFQKCLSKESMDFFRNNFDLDFEKEDNIYKFQYYIMNILKQNTLNLVNDVDIKYKPYIFTTLQLDKSKYNDIFILVKDFMILYALLRLFDHYLNRVENQNYKTNKTYHQIKMLDLFIRQVSAPLLTIIRKEDVNDLANIIEADTKHILDSKIVKTLSDIFSDLTMGGKFPVNSKNLIDILVKSCDIILKSLNNNNACYLKNIDEYLDTYKIKKVENILKCPEDIKLQMYPDSSEPVKEKRKYNKKLKEEPVEQVVEKEDKTDDFDDIDDYLKLSEIILNEL